MQKISYEAIHDGLLAPGGIVTAAPPVGIFHPVFDQFISDANDSQAQPPAEIITTTQKFMYANTVIPTNEAEGNERLLQDFRDILDMVVISEKNQDNTSPDGMVMCPTAKGTCCPVLIVERKHMLGDGGCDPSIQAGYSTRRAWLQDTVSLQVFSLFCLPYSLRDTESWCA